MKIYPRLTSRKRLPLPSRTVTIVQKKGKDVIKDEFINFHVKRPSLIELIVGMFNS